MVRETLHRRHPGCGQVASLRDVHRLWQENLWIVGIVTGRARQAGETSHGHSWKFDQSAPIHVTWASHAARVPPSACPALAVSDFPFQIRVTIVFGVLP